MTDTNDDSDPPTVSLETEEEIDWLAKGRQEASVSAAEARREYIIQATKELLQTPERPWHDVAPEDVDDAYQQFINAVNMTASEIRNWGDDECSDKASVKPAEVRQQIIRLLETPKEEWGHKELTEATRVSSFISCMRDVEPGDPATDGCPSDRDISLMNWGYTPDSADVDF
jgi:hypothetical protein